MASLGPNESIKLSFHSSLIVIQDADAHMESRFEIKTKYSCQTCEFIIMAEEKKHSCWSVCAIFLSPFRWIHTPERFILLHVDIIVTLDDFYAIALHMLSCNSLWPTDAMWRPRIGSTLAQVMACCLMATSHYLNQCWLISISGHYRKNIWSYQTVK